jgi:hypothetical protein
MSTKNEQRAAGTPAWWLPRTIPVGQTLDCQLGPLSLQIHRGHGEWHVSMADGDEREGGGCGTLGLRAGGIDGDNYERFIFSGASAQLKLLPLLADRPVVIRPRQPIFLPSGEQTTMYLSSPLTLRLLVGDPGVLLREVPMVRLSDTWFGPSTREGELCYSGRTHARHELAEVPQRAHRAVTPLHIRNEALTPLPLEKVSLPVPFLSVYGAADGGLWTQKATMIRRSDSDMAVLKIERAPPEFGGPMSLISGPRREQGRGGFVRAFNVLFGDGS